MKRRSFQRLIYKINTTMLRDAKWDLKIDLTWAIRNGCVVSIGDSQMLRWIDEMNCVSEVDEKIAEIRKKIRLISKMEDNPQNRRDVKRLYRTMNLLQFKPDYMCLIIDKEKDYWRAAKGFKINGVKYVRLLGTNGGVKNSTIVFVSERLAPELRKRVDNGRNHEVLFVPAKLDAYNALTCSGTDPVSYPKGILVVPDCITTFKEDILCLDDEEEGEPRMQLKKDELIELDESDGYGLMLPSLAERWSQELGLGYTMCAANSRLSWEKGMIFTFDFVDFAEKVAHQYIVTDAWGNKVDIRNVELILTTSMLKLWNCYDSIEDYLANSEANHYTFGIPKVCPEKLENERQLNYQFIQSYDLTDEMIDELLEPTIREIKDILSDDWRRTLLYLKGLDMNEKNVRRSDNDYVKAIMANPEIYNDPHIRSKVMQLIRNRIDRAKIGVINVHGNFSIVCGDPYALCQSIFELPVTGLMNAGEIYNKYWVDDGAEYLAVFRAPMSTHENVRKAKVCRSEEAAYWYRYLTTCTLFNCWDSAAAAMNGMDKDGDLVMITDNKILVDNIRPLPTIFCKQRAAVKMDPTEDDMIADHAISAGTFFMIGNTLYLATSQIAAGGTIAPGTNATRLSLADALNELV